MNLKIKFRESFRPFAPCVLREKVHDWFEMEEERDSPYMLLVAGVRPEVSVQDVFRGASPFFVADALTIAALIAFPGIVLFLPGQLLN